jgi:hypothetical protein
MQLLNSCNDDGEAKLANTFSQEVSVSGRTVGILGQPWRATVTTAGDVYPWDEVEAIRWYVAADDRWHIPTDEVAVRQRSIEGAPVLETRLRIPGGDVIQRIWVASGRQGSSALMMEFENDSPMAIAIAIDRQNLLVSRLVAVRSVSGEWPAPGLDIPREPTVIPVGHRTSARAALITAGTATELQVADFADWSAVVRGWVALSEQASNFKIADLRDSLRVDELIVAERTEIALNPTECSDEPQEAVRWLEEQRELKRMKLNEEFDESDLVELAGAIEAISRAVKRGRLSTALALKGMNSARYLLGTEQERAVEDLRKLVAKMVGTKKATLMSMLSRAATDSSSASAEPMVISELESEFAIMTDDDCITLLPNGMKPERLGVQFEAHGLALGAEFRVSFAVRWHGPNAAVIWEIEGPRDITLRSGVDHSWVSSHLTGEALWRVDNVPETALATSDGVSFS